MRTSRIVAAAAGATALLAAMTPLVEQAGVAGAAPSPAVSPTVIYDTTSTPPVASPSFSFQASQTSELGNLVQFAAGPRLLTAVTVTMDSWACQFGSWTGQPQICTTDPGATFTEPITLNLYAVSAHDAVGARIASFTQTFTIPYRPTSDLAACPDGETFVFDGQCVHGLPADITFALGDLVVPSELIWTVAYNTSNYGASPYGSGTPCANTPIVPAPSSGPTTYDDCPYDSLNVLATEAAGPSVGTDPLPGTAYVDAALGGDYCDGGTAGVGTLRLDSMNDLGAPCYGVNTPAAAPWYIPAAQFQALPEVSVASSDTTATVGHPVTFTVTAPPTATMSVSVDNGPTPIGTCDPSGGTCSVATSSLGIGEHLIRAVYAGDGTFPAFTSAPIVQSVSSVPAAPGHVAATPGDASAVVSWSVPYAGNALLGAYTVTSTPGGLTCTTTTTNCTVSGLTNGVPYRFRVVASNAVGTGPAGTTGTVIPGAPGFHVYTTVPVVLASHNATVSATGGAPDGAITLGIAGIGTRTVTADANGAAFTTFHLPLAGRYGVTARNGASRATTYLFVALVTNPSAASHTSSVTIGVRSAIPGSTVVVTTSDDGTFSVPVPGVGNVSVALPPPPSGTMVVAVTDNGYPLAVRSIPVF